MADSAHGKASPQELLFTYKGISYPKMRCSSDTFQALQDFVSRRDDLMLVSYPKCGTNWCLQILNNLAATVSGSEEIKPNFDILEFGAADKYKKMETLPSPRVYATHFHHDNLPKAVIQNGTKILVIFRNPKDTAVSLFHFHAKNPAVHTYNDWDDYFRDFISGNVVWGSYFDHAMIWNKHIEDENVMLITYEDLKENLAGGVQKIAEFFSLSATEEQIRLIAERATFDAMKARSQETHGGFGNALFRKGDVGDWKNYFSEAQNREMDAKFEECLAGTKLGKMLNYDTHCKS
ncbi:sulfotransferase 6B1 [Lissotriton helveticus]